MSQTWIDEFRLALRRLLARPGFSLIVVAVLGTGLAAMLFGAGALDSFVLRALPFPQAERLLYVSSQEAGEARDTLGLLDAELLDLERRQASLERHAAWYVGTANLNVDGRAERLSGTFVHGPLLSLLGAAPALGRDFSAAELAAGGPPAVLLGHDLWQRSFGGGVDVLGRSVRINGSTRAVIGVMPPGFGFPHQEQLWLNQPAQAGGTFYRSVIALPRPGAGAAQVRAELGPVLEEHARRAGVVPRQAYASPFTEGFIHPTTRIVVWVLAGAGLLTLLIALSNVVTLLLARATVRAGEFELRAALGAGRGALLREVFSEALLLASAAMAVALVLAHLASQWIHLKLLEVDDGVPYWMHFGIDLRLFGAALLAALACGLLAGLYPALKSAGASGQPRLRSSGKGALGGASPRLMATLVVLEVAVCLVLLTGGAVMKRHLDELRGRPLGADPAQVLTGRIGLFEQGYPDPAARAAYRRELGQRLQAEPGFSAVSLSDGLPGARATWTRARLEQANRDESGGTPIHAVAVDPQYFALYRIGLDQGRTIAAADTAESEPVVVIDRRLAQALFPAGAALGRKLRLESDPPGRWRTVVGISAPVQHDDLDEEWRPAVFTPFAQGDPAFFQVSLKYRGSQAEAAQLLQQAVAKLDPDTPVYFVESLDALIAMGNFGPSFLARIFSGMALVALLLAATGLYGVLAYGIERRTREFGLKRALGASQGAVLRSALRGGIAQMLLGALLGLPLALLFAQLLLSINQTAAGIDLAAVGVAGVVLLLAGCAAALVPARRALQVDPMVALRSE